MSFLSGARYWAPLEHIEREKKNHSDKCCGGNTVGICRFSAMISFKILAYGSFVPLIPPSSIVIQQQLYVTSFSIKINKNKTQHQCLLLVS